VTASESIRRCSVAIKSVFKEGFHAISGSLPRSVSRAPVTGSGTNSSFCDFARRKQWNRVNRFLALVGLALLTGTALAGVILLVLLVLFPMTISPHGFLSRCFAFQDYRDQLVLADNAGDLRKGKERYQHDEHHKPDQQHPLDASSAQRWHAFGDGFVVKHSDKHFFQNLTTNQKYGEHG
jgi:hypothetical protein